jgi:serine-type D-Ala-D-Ala carboxypeptidase (penicillin-binding protein 5/6)
MKKQPRANSNFVPFVATSYILITLFSISINQPKKTSQIVTLPPSEISDSTVPVAIASSVAPELTAQGVIVYDAASAKTLFEKNADMPLLPASTTKIMTALVAIKSLPMDMTVTISNPLTEGQKMSLFQGEQIKVKDLLAGMLIYSANDAAEALAQSYPGGREEFIKAMNALADEYGMANSHFENPTGFDGGGHYSTARDMIRLAQISMRNKQFAELVATKQTTVASTDGRFPHKLVNLNELLGSTEGVLGIKTGWTENAQENLITYIERDNKKVFIALLGSKDRFAETKLLIDWIFQN